MFNWLLQEDRDKIKILIEDYKKNTPTLEKLSINDLHNDDMTTYNAYFDSFPHSEIWRMFIDSKVRQTEKGWLDFEKREPGYIAAMLLGWTFMEASFNEPISSSLIQSLHAACTNKITESLQPECTPGQCRDNFKTGVGIIFGRNATVAGLLEIYENKNNYYAIEENQMGEMRLNGTQQPLSTITAFMDKIVQKYNVEIAKAISADEKLKVIIEFITTLERTHPFVDGNTRTFSMLVLNRELMRNGFSPVILEDPNRFAGLGQDELYNEIIKGMRDFQQIRLGKEKILGVTTEEINEAIEQSSNDDFNLYKNSQRALAEYSASAPQNGVVAANP